NGAGTTPCGHLRQRSGTGSRNMSSSLIKDVKGLREIIDQYERETPLRELKENLRPAISAELTRLEDVREREIYADLAAIREREEAEDRIVDPRLEITPREELERRIESLDEVLLVHASERYAELENDVTIDPERIEDIVAIEIDQLRRERDELGNQLRGLNAELGLEQEMGMER